MSYEYVVEADDPELKNGGIQHKYDYTTTSWVDLIRGDEIKSVPAKLISSTYGYETETEYFDDDTVLVKKVAYYYNNDPYYQNEYIASATRKSLSHHLQTQSPF